MQIGKFVTGMLNDTIQRHQTKNVDTLLKEENLKFLYELTEVGEWIYIWEDENAMSKSIVTKQKDVHGRNGLLNKTVIIKFENVLKDILAYTNIIELLDGELYAPLEPVYIS